MDPGNDLSRRYVVHGRVQGVGFRDAVHQRANAIGGLRGHVRNLRDGSVEVCVAAEAAKVRALAEFLHRGPPIARVDRVDEGPFEPGEPPGRFSIRFGG